MDLIEAIKGRRAVRSFTGRRIPRETILGLLEAAVAAPSATNLQPWSFAIVEGAERLADMSASAKRFLLSAAPTDFSRSAHRGALEDPAFNLFYGASCLIVICARPPSRQAAEDCCLAAQNLMLAAHAGGLGSCWVGYARPWLEHPQTRAALGLLADQVPVAPIVVGEPSIPPTPTDRHRPSVIWC